MLGPFIESELKNKYILVMVDQFSKWLELAAIPEQTAEQAATKCLCHFIVTFGCPLEVHTDQGCNFDSNLFKSMCEALQIAKTRTSPYHPSSNGQAEIQNRLILQFIRCFSGDKPDQWDKCLPFLSMAQHSNVNRQTGFTPNRLMLGREVILPIDLMLGTDYITSCQPAHKWVVGLTETMSKVHELARTHLKAAQQRQKRDYDLRLVQHPYEVGNIVYKLDSSTKVVVKALKPVWQGPYLVIDTRPLLYKLKNRKRESVVAS